MVALTIIGATAIVLLQVYQIKNAYLEEELKQCQNDEIDMKMALYDVLLVKMGSKSKGHLNCFCMNKLMEHFLNIKKIKFADGMYHCKKWYEKFESLVMKDYTAPMIAAGINLVSSQIFILLAKNER